MKLVVIESPYAGDVEKNLTYVRAAMKDCFKRGEAPFASHALYTQPGVLDDTNPEERKLGIEAGFEWGDVVERIGYDEREVYPLTVFYVDLGFSKGMKAALERCKANDREFEIRFLEKE